MATVDSLPLGNDEQPSRAYAPETAVWADPDGYAWLDPTADIIDAPDDTHPMPVERRGDGWWAWPASSEGRAALRCRGLGEVGIPGIPFEDLPPDE